MGKHHKKNNNKIQNPKIQSKKPCKKTKQKNSCLFTLLGCYFYFFFLKRNAVKVLFFGFRLMNYLCGSPHVWIFHKSWMLISRLWSLARWHNTWWCHLCHIITWSSDFCIINFLILVWVSNFKIILKKKITKRFLLSISVLLILKKYFLQKIIILINKITHFLPRAIIP